jgi:uncharacterized Ntn-hydrolase superfamily protein
VVVNRNMDVAEQKEQLLALVAADAKNGGERGGKGSILIAIYHTPPLLSPPF